MTVLKFIHDFFEEYPGFLAFLICMSVGTLIALALEFWIPCLHPFEDGAFCSYCGYQLLDQCPGCGSFCSASFCAICGASVS